MAKKDNNTYEIPTKEEYLRNKRERQEKELHSERFAEINRILKDNYWNRENVDVEEKLFSIVGSYGIEDNFLYKSNSEKRLHRFKRYKKLQEFLTSLDLKTISSNIFLRTALQLMEASYSHCVAIYKELLIQISKTTIFDDEIKKFEITCDIPRALEGFIPLSVLENVGIPYYRPQDYKISYIDVLDKEHKYVYEDYNKYASKIKQLAEDIYLLQMNLFTNSFPGDLFNSQFIFYMPDKYTQMIVTYFLKPNDLLKNNGIQCILEEFENNWNNGTLNVEQCPREYGVQTVEQGPVLNKKRNIM